MKRDNRNKFHRKLHKEIKKERKRREHEELIGILKKSKPKRIKFN